MKEWVIAYQVSVFEWTAWINFWKFSFAEFCKCLHKMLLCLKYLDVWRD